MAGCSAFQGADTAQIAPTPQDQPTKLAPLPAVAPGSAKPAAPGPATAAPGAVPARRPVDSLNLAHSGGLSEQSAASNPPPAAPVTANAGVPPNLPPPRAPGSLAGAAIAAPAATGPAFTPQTPRALSGDWRVGEPGRPAPCLLVLSPSGVAGVLDATTQGCSSAELSRTAGWQSRGEDIVLLDQRASPIVLFRPAGANRYEGLGLVGATFVLSR